MMTINQKIQFFLKSHKYQRIRILIFLVSAVIVIFAVICSLIKPAVSMTGDLMCTAEEHIHTDDCYSDILVCGKNESSGHIHDESCYSHESVLICSKEEDEYHFHSNDCYEINDILKCNKPEGEGHIHTDECYENQLVCTKDEHFHNEECYQKKSVDNDISEISELNPIAEVEDTELISFSNTLTEKNIKYYSGTDIDTNVSVNFSQHISSVTYKETTSISEDENIKPVKFTVHYTLPSNTLMQINDNKQIYYKLPENVIIMDVQSGPVKENGQETGTYRITEDGYIVIDFYSNYVKDGSSEISGDITFNANVKRTDINSEKEVVTMGNASVDVDFSKIAKSDLSVNKSNSGYNSDTNTIEYQVNISSINGSGNGDITITDYLVNADSSLIKLNLIDGQQINIIKNKADGSSENITSSVIMSSDGKATINGLPALAAGESYSLEYSALLTPGEKAKIINSKNKVTVTNGTLTDEDTDELEVATGCILKKSGSYNEKTDNINWTITILNPLGSNISGYTVTDEMLSKTVDGTFKVYDKNNNIVSNPGTLDTDTNTFSFGDLTGTEYRLVYETKSPDHGKTITNTAKLKNGDTEINDGIGEAYVGNDRQYISKSGKGSGYDDNGNVIIEWSVNLEFQQGDFTGKIYTDTMSADTQHYMTAQQIDAMTVTGTKPNYESLSLAKGTDYTLKYFDAAGDEITDISNDSVRISSYQIIFADNDNISSLSDIKILYKSIGIIDNNMAIGESKQFKNIAQFDSVESDSSYTETKKEALKKFDGKKEGQYNTSYLTNELEKDENGKYILKWYIIANESNNYGDNDITLTDTLPLGVDFIESSVKFQKHNGSYYESASGISMSVTKLDAGNQQVTFSIPASVHEGKAFRIDYSVSVTEEDVIKYREGTSTAFVNTVTDGINTTSQTQNISFPLITKSGSDPSDTYDGDIIFTLDINPYAEKLSEGEFITVTDRMRHYSAKDENGNFISINEKMFTATLVSLTVLDAETNEELDPSQYKLTYSDEEIYTVNYAQFIAVLPDAKHLKIQYVYHLASNSTAGYNGKVENDVVIDYGIGTQTVHYENNYDLEKESSAHSTTSDYIKIYKVDSDNFAIRLGKAKFNIYRWSNNQWQPLVGETKLSDGGVQADWSTDTSALPKELITDNDNGDYRLPALEQGVLYKLIEIQAPDDYVRRTEPYYFVLNSIPSSIPSEVQRTNIATLLKGGIINVENEKMQNVEVKVNKHWGEGSTLQPVEVQLFRALKSNSDSSDSSIITVNITDNKDHTVTKQFKVYKNENIVLTVETLDSYFDYPSKLLVNEIDKTSDVSEISRGWNGNPDDTKFATCYTFTVGNISGKTTIDMKFTNSQDYSKYNIELSNCTEITGDTSGESNVIEIPSDAVPITGNDSEETITLDSENNWTYTWSGLPKSDTSGNLYYYYVKELTEISGYTAEYDINGVNGGEINITNRENGKIPTLPNTGSFGVRHIILTGFALIIISVGCYYLINQRNRKGDANRSSRRC